MDGEDDETRLNEKVQVNTSDQRKAFSRIFMLVAQAWLIRTNRRPLLMGRVFLSIER